MLRRVLLGVDRTPGSLAARRLAIALARSSDATVLGVAALDFYWLDPQALWSGQQEASSLLAELEDAARQEGVACEVRAHAAEPSQAIPQEATTADLLVLGRDATFWAADQAKLLDSLKGLLRRVPRPLLLVPEQETVTDRVLVAFDGSPPASRALHLFALLGLARGADMHVLSIAEGRDAAVPLADAGAVLLRAHGARSVQAVAVASDADAAEMIVSHARAVGAGLVVMGAYGRSGLRDLLFGSCTRRLLTTSPFGLFVHH